MKTYKKVLIGLGCLFFFFFLIGTISSDCPKCEDKIITKEVIKEVKVDNVDYDLLKTENKKLKDEINIRTQIMAIDDKALANGSNGLILCADAIEALYYGRNTDSIFSKVEYLTNSTNILADQKVNLLLQLEQ